MNLDRKNMEKIIILGIIFILIYLGVQNMNVVVGFFFWVLSMLTPFLIAVIMTFFLNVPLKAIEKRLFRPKNGKPVKPILEKMRRPLALVFSILIILLVIGAFLTIIIPEMGKSINQLIASLPDAVDNLNKRVYDIAKDNDTIMDALRNVKPDYGKEVVQNGKTVLVDSFFDGQALTSYISGFLSNNAGGVVSYTMNMVSTVVGTAVNILLGLVLSIYTLLNKERMSMNVKKLIYAALPSKGADFIVELGHLTNMSFYNSITGQMMECLILGSLVTLGMTIFGFPYAALVGVVVAIMCWIPMFGIWIGAGIGTLFVLTVDPVQAIWFLVFMVCLQQIEGNFIFPRVVGTNMGLPPLLMISAIVLFSSFFGIVGLIISCPVTSVVYTLTRRFVFTNLRKKKIPPEKYEVVPEEPKPKLRKPVKGYAMIGKITGKIKKNRLEKENSAAQKPVKTRSKKK